MRINLQLQTSDFVDVDLACDHCHGSSKSHFLGTTVHIGEVSTVHTSETL